jgi:AcrR family transcriptional regulator
MVGLLLAAATRVLCKRGYDGTTTNEIAAVAGVSVGSLYQYFPNKEVIVGELIERHDAAMWAVFTAHVDAVERPIAQAAASMIDALFAGHLVEPELHKVLHETVPRIGKLARLRETNQKAALVVEEFLRARAAEVSIAHPRAAAFVIVEAVEAVIHGSIELPAGERDAVKREALTLVLRYLGVPDL